MAIDTDLEGRQMDLKRKAAERAADFLSDVRILGLGTGSTAAHFAEVIAERRAAGELLDLVAVPTSIQTQRLAEELGIPLSTLKENRRLDLTVDGADEVDPNLDLIKGHGGALTREKIVASASARMVVIVDESKLVDCLGDRFTVPVEVVQFGWEVTCDRLAELGAEWALREGDDGPYITDQGNYIVDCGFGDALREPDPIARAVNNCPGVVEHGLFLGIADHVVVAAESGVRVLDRS
jgi:ribose 5-phosphate isomerase A